MRVRQGASAFLSTVIGNQASASLFPTRSTRKSFAASNSGWESVEDVVKAPLRAARRLESAIGHPESAVRQVGQALEGVGEIGWAFANPAPRIPLNVEIGSHRRYLWVRSDLAHFKKIKDALGGTVKPG